MRLSHLVRRNAAGKGVAYLSCLAFAGLGYKLPAIGRAKEVTVQLNVTNLFDASYIGPMGTGGYSLNSDLQTLQAGARRLMFLTVGTSF